MKVLHISRGDSSGGAAIAAYRHHESMLSNGIDSKMLVIDKTSDDVNVINMHESKLKKFYHKILNRVLKYRKNYFGTWSLNKFGNDISNHPLVLNADVIILHWINAYTINLKSIERILKTGKPVYWFLHDMWAITGGCHHSLQCNRYQTHCYACPLTNSNKGTNKIRDLSYGQFEEKLRCLSPYLNLHFLTPSKWLADCVKKSRLFRAHEIKVLRNPLNINLFTPRDKSKAREKLGLPVDKKLLLFGADNITSPYKGWNLLKNALEANFPDIEVVIYGTAPNNIEKQIYLPTHVMGRIDDTDTLIDLYSACDVFITTSIAENYPNVLIEAMACGLPCIGTNVGGISEIIDEEINGILVNLNEKQIRKAIIDMVTSSNYHELSSNAVTQIRNTNSYQVQDYSFLEI